MSDDGSLWTGWRTISGSRYYFYPESGKCALNVAMPIGDSWYLFGTDGKMQTGFQNVNGNTYYFDPSTGVMYAGTTRTVNGMRQIIRTKNQTARPRRKPEPKAVPVL